MNDGVTITVPVHFARRAAGQRELREGAAPPPLPESGGIPRLSRLMALAIRFEELVRTGEMEDFAAIAACSHVTRSRVSQIINLRNLAPDIQEEILHLPPAAGPRSGLVEGDLRRMVLEPDWRKQRAMWGELKVQANVSLKTQR